MRRPPTALFWTYDPETPSFRHRLLPVRAELEAAGWSCPVRPFPHRRYVRRVLERRAELGEVDLLVVAKINLALGEARLVRRSAGTIVFDFDDAIWVRKPRRLGEPPGRSWLRRLKFARTCGQADLVTAGNATLAAAAGRHARRVERVQTTVDVARYEAADAPSERGGNVLVWIGLPENLPYLELVRPALVRLARERPGTLLRVVSSEFPDWPDMPIERVPWSVAAEVAALVGADVGLMPLPDDEWTRGKCAFKLLQYMAAALPCVASPVGANREAVLQDETGLFAATTAEWVRDLRRLLDDPALARRVGRGGREHARRHYDRASVAARAAALYRSLLPEAALTASDPRSGPRARR